MEKVFRFVMRVGDFVITKDDQGNHALLDSHCREVGAGPEIEAMTAAANLLMVKK